MQIGNQFLRGSEVTAFLYKFRMWLLTSELKCDEELCNAYKETAVHASKHADSLDESEARFSKAVAQGMLSFQTLSQIKAFLRKPGFLIEFVFRNEKAIEKTA